MKAPARTSSRKYTPEASPVSVWFTREMKVFHCSVERSRFALFRACSRFSTTTLVSVGVMRSIFGSPVLVPRNFGRFKGAVRSYTRRM